MVLFVFLFIMRSGREELEPRPCCDLRASKGDVAGVSPIYNECFRVLIMLLLRFLANKGESLVSVPSVFAVPDTP